MSYPTYPTLDLEKLQRAVSAWSTRNFGGTDVVDAELSALGLGEEVGEVMRALIKRRQGIRGTHEEWTAELKKELGDVVIKLCDVADRAGLDLAQCARDRWASVSQRNWIDDRQGHGIE